MKIFLDVDGVFADMDKRIREICGPDTPRFSNDIWIHIAKEWRFFWHLELIPESLRLITMLQHHDLAFLTALPESREGQHGLASADADKRAWLQHHISRSIPIHTIVGGRNKPQYLKYHPGAVLIDDYERNINLWSAAGGVGILHTDAQSTIDQLALLKLI